MISVLSLNKSGSSRTGSRRNVLVKVGTSTLR